MIGPVTDKRIEKPIRAFFVDSENGAEKLLEGMELLTRSDVIVIFHRACFPAALANKLEMGPSAVEWIKCVDQGIKNSMDVQIIAECAMRLVEGRFESGFIVSEDKGFLPAVHYLQQTPKGRNHEIALVKNVAHAAQRAVPSALTALKRADTAEDIEHALAPLFGEDEAKRLTKGFERVFAGSPVGEGVRGGGTAISKDSALEAARCAEVPAEEASDRTSFVDLPGIGRALAGKLEGAGISSPAELEEIGAVEAWSRIYLQDKSFPPKWVYSFEAAIKGIPARSIDPKRKRRLNNDIKALMTKGQCMV